MTTPYAFLFAMGFALVPAALAQSVGDCETGEAEAYLDVNNVRALIPNTGGLHYKQDVQAYEVPKGSGLHPIFASGIWIGGLVAGTLRTAASRHGPWEFWPGPLDEAGHPPEDCSAYDRIYTVSRQDVLTYNETEEATADLAEWPVTLGAPVIDGDGVPGNYNLRGGDRPALVGDQMLWWVMNDRGNEHRWSSRTLTEPQAPPVLPLGLEVQATAFAFEASRGAFAHTTFYRYRLIYHGNAPLEASWFGVYVDPDLGRRDDDYAGSDTTLGMGFVYNGQDEDAEYGARPPALGVVLLQGPVIPSDGKDNNGDGSVDEPGERAGMTKFMAWWSDVTARGDPVGGEEAYAYLRGLWRDGTPLTFGGTGYGGIELADFAFPGDPVTGAFWSEMNMDDEGTALTPTDMRFLVATGPFRMEPGDEQEVVVGIVWSRGEDRFDSVRKLRSHAGHIRSVFDQTMQPDTSLVVRRSPERPVQHTMGRNHPNPFRQQTAIRYDVAREGPVRLEVFDLLGRRIATLVDEVQVADRYEVTFDGSGLPPGLYVYRLIVQGYLVGTRTMLLVH